MQIRLTPANPSYTAVLQPRSNELTRLERSINTRRSTTGRTVMLMCGSVIHLNSFLYMCQRAQRAVGRNLSMNVLLQEGTSRNMACGICNIPSYRDTSPVCHASYRTWTNLTALQITRSKTLRCACKCSRPLLLLILTTVSLRQRRF